MENNKDNSKLLLAFVIGAVAGAAIGYILASGKKDEFISDLKETGGKIKEEIKSALDKGKKFADEILKEVDNFPES